MDTVLGMILPSQLSLYVTSCRWTGVPWGALGRKGRSHLPHAATSSGWSAS